MGCGRVLKILGWRSREGGLCVNGISLSLDLFGKNGVFLALMFM